MWHIADAILWEDDKAPEVPCVVIEGREIGSIVKLPVRRPDGVLVARGKANTDAP